jgi:hypothetical protein
MININEFILIFFKNNLRESQLYWNKRHHGMWMHLILFWAIEIHVFLSSHGLHCIFPPHPLVHKTFFMYIANKIAKDQYVQQSNVATTTILTMTPDHMYTTHRTTTISWYYGSPPTTISHTTTILTLIIEVSAFLKWIFNF